MKNQEQNVNVNAQVENAKTPSLKSLANDASKAEMFSIKQALASVKGAYDADTERKDARAYIESLGFTANVFKQVKKEDIEEFVTLSKSGKCSTWGILNALNKYADAKGIKKAKESKKQAKTKKSATKDAKNAAPSKSEKKSEQKKSFLSFLSK